MNMPLMKKKDREDDRAVEIISKFEKKKPPHLTNERRLPNFLNIKNKLNSYL